MQTPKQPSPKNYPYEEEFSFRNLFEKWKNDLVYLWRYHRIKLVIAGFIGAIFGVLLAWYWPVTYTARLTFVVEESKSGGGSLVSALAGQFGFDMGSISGSGGVLDGDNVQELLRSQKMIKNTLLTPLTDSSEITLADRYADSYGLKKKWVKHSKGSNSTIMFQANAKTYTRLQDSLMHVMIKRITDKELSVSKPDKKLTFFRVSISMRDEMVSQLFCQRLIKQATDFYIQTKTKRQRTNVNRLQIRADSIGILLNKKTYSASAANQILLDANPAYPTSNVGSELRERDKIVLSTIYSEIIKNLEVSRTMLIQETPAFQIVDEPELPLKKNEMKYLTSILACLIILVAIYSMFLLSFRRPDHATNKNTGY